MGKQSDGWAHQHAQPKRSRVSSNLVANGAPSSTVRSRGGTFCHGGEENLAAEAYGVIVEGMLAVAIEVEVGGGFHLSFRSWWVVEKS
jgi:hypothetical protein